MCPLQPGEETDAKVEFTVKELLARIDGKIDIITNLVHEKADKADVSRLEDRVSGLEKRAAERTDMTALETRVNVVEKDMATKAAVEENTASLAKYNTKLTWTIVGTIISIAGVAITFMSYLAHVTPTH